MIIIILSIYGIINLFYFIKLIPPVPLALDKGIVAYNITLKNNNYLVIYESLKISDIILPETVMADLEAILLRTIQNQFYVKFKY